MRFNAAMNRTSPGPGPKYTDPRRQSIPPVYRWREITCRPFGPLQDGPDFSIGAVITTPDGEDILHAWYTEECLVRALGSSFGRKLWSDILTALAVARAFFPDIHATGHWLPHNPHFSARPLTSTYAADPDELISVIAGRCVNLNPLPAPAPTGPPRLVYRIFRFLFVSPPAAANRLR